MFTKLYLPRLLVLFLTAAVTITACKKETPLTIPPVEASFADNTDGNYYIKDDPNSQYKVPVGITTVAATDTKVNITVSSPTGAKEGEQYTIPAAEVTIAAGKVLDSFVVKGLFAGYPTGRKDTLIVRISSAKGDGAVPLISNDSFVLVMQKYCDVVLEELAGDYNNCFDKQDGSPDYGPYYINAVAGTTTGTKGSVTLQNFWDVGGNVKVDLDWTDPSNFSTSIEDQFLYDDSRYGEARIRGVGKGSFSSCDNKFTVVYEVYVSAGSFGVLTTEVSR